ncbi:hypothetical protein K3495_g7205 [Podosphaera aphanis]|nr:hypothetical protein K3495_g7205 [Podosphaera aphanis]
MANGFVDVITLAIATKESTIAPISNAHSIRKMANLVSKYLNLCSSLFAYRVIILLAIILIQVSDTAVPHQQREPQWNRNTSQSLFQELEQLSRIVDISYCVGNTGISRPFNCASRCSDFPTFELIDTFHSIPEGTCGYIALDHGSDGTPGRMLVAFRGTYSITDFVLDLSAFPQDYVPYQGHEVPKIKHPVLSGLRKIMQRFGFTSKFPWHYGSQNPLEQDEEKHSSTECTKCTVHLGFWTSYQSVRSQILFQIQRLSQKYPDYRLHLVGHSLGGAIAALAGLELDSLGFAPVITTFGQPRIGNSGLRDYIDTVFNLPSDNNMNEDVKPGNGSRYRRVTHKKDPVPRLPLQKWGYRSHAGEIFIAKVGLRPQVGDVRLCYGDDDVHCLANSESDESFYFGTDISMTEIESYDSTGAGRSGDSGTSPYPSIAERSTQVPIQTKVWHLFSAHRDYFWRLGLCIPGGDPIDWGRGKYIYDEARPKR